MRFSIQAKAPRIQTGEAPKLASAILQAPENAQLIGFVRPEIKTWRPKKHRGERPKPHRNRPAPARGELN